MKSISILMHEATAEDIEKLPAGFPVLEFDNLYETIRTLQAGVDKIRRDKRYVYLLYKMPPAEIEFAASSSKLEKKHAWN